MNKACFKRLGLVKQNEHEIESKFKAKFIIEI